MTQNSFITGIPQTHRQEGRALRSSSAHLQLDRTQPKYINQPKVFMKKAVNLEEYNRDSNGETLKHLLLEEFSSIQRDYATQERISANVVKSQQQYQERVEKMDMKTKEQLCKIEQNRAATIEKKIKIKKKKAFLKNREFQERKKEMEATERQNYLKKMEDYKRKMDEFFKQKEHKEYLRSQFKYDQSSFDNMKKRKEQKMQQEYEYSDQILQNCMEKQNRVAHSHDRIMYQKRNRLMSEFQTKEDLCEKQRQNEVELDQTNVQALGEKYEKIDQMQEERLKKLEKERKKQKRKLYLRELQRQENIETMKNEAEKQKKMQTERYEQIHKAHVESLTPIFTMYDLTMQKKELNDFRTAQTKYNQEMIKKQQSQKNDNVMDKHLLHTKQNQTTKEVRQKIKDFRLNARFKQKEELRLQRMSSTCA